MQNILFSNIFNLVYSVCSHYSKASKSSSIQELLEKFDTKEEIEEEEFKTENQEPEETKEEFETKKRQLLILLDQAVMTKMKISKAFPEKLKTFGDTLVIFLNL